MLFRCYTSFYKISLSVILCPAGPSLSCSSSLTSLLLCLLYCPFSSHPPSSSTAYIRRGFLNFYCIYLFIEGVERTIWGLFSFSIMWVLGIKPRRLCGWEQASLPAKPSCRPWRRWFFNLCDLVHLAGNGTTSVSTRKQHFLMVMKVLSFYDFINTLK